MTEADDDALLVALVQSGDLSAFEELLRRIHKPLRSYVSRVAAESQTEDILQEIALTLYRNIRFLSEPKAFWAWTFRIATRIAFRHVKRERRWRQISDAWEAECEPVEPATFDSSLFPLIDRLSPASRAVLLLHYQQELSIEETAAILEIPIGTVKSRLAYGVAKLRELIKGPIKDPTK